MRFAASKTQQDQLNLHADLGHRMPFEAAFAGDYGIKPVQPQHPRPPIIEQGVESLHIIADAIHPIKRGASEAGSSHHLAASAITHLAKSSWNSIALGGIYCTMPVARIFLFLWMKPTVPAAPDQPNDARHSARADPPASAKMMAIDEAAFADVSAGR